MDAPDFAQSLAKERIIDRYTQKWDDILFSTGPIDRTKAEAAIIKAYNSIDLPTPDIYFLSSPSEEQCRIFSDVSERHANDRVVFLKSELNQKITTSFKQIYNYTVDGLGELGRWAEISERGEKFSQLCWLIYNDYLYKIYSNYAGNPPIAPQMSFFPPQEAIENPSPELDSYWVRLFQGDRGEIYYVA